jgi:anti-sigma factor RsiW
MTCHELDWNGYVLGEAPASERARMAEHAAKCPSCREELERLELTRATLRMLPEEEIPRRIAFVSDKVFEATWWQRLWARGPGWGFASAALLAAAIVTHGFAARPAAPAVAPGLTEAQVQARIESELSRRVGELVAQAVAASEARQTEQTVKAVQAAVDIERKNFAMQRQADMLAVEDNLRLIRKQMSRAMYLATNYPDEKAGQQ